MMSLETKFKKLQQRMDLLYKERELYNSEHARTGIDEQIARINKRMKEVAFCLAILDRKRRGGKFLYDRFGEAPQYPKY